jgi:hypothetical protein
VLAAGLRTADLGGAGTKKVGTVEMGDAILAQMEQVSAAS